MESVIKWRKGPAQGGHGTAGENSWWDGDLLLCIVGTAGGDCDVFAAGVSADEDHCSLLDSYGDVVDWDFSDISWYAVLNDSLANSQSCGAPERQRAESPLANG